MTQYIQTPSGDYIHPLDTRRRRWKAVVAPR